MNTPLLSNGVGELRYSATIPPALLACLLTKAIPRGVSGPFGDFLFQEIRTPQAVVWYNNYLLLKNTQFTNSNKLPKIELQFGLSNNFTYKGEGLGKRDLHDGSFNLLYVPSVNSQMNLRTGRLYTTFDIYLTPVLMFTLAEHFPVLNPFLEKVAKKEATMLCAINQLTTVPMNTIIGEILKNTYTGTAHGYFVAQKVVELLIVTMDRVTQFPKVKEYFFRDEELELISEAKDELLKNLDKPITLLILSRKVGLNMHKLKNGFQQLYGNTVASYRLHARMREATLLLNTTNESVEGIGFTTGYANAQHFSKAYKKYYGHSPARVRKDRDLKEKAAGEERARGKNNGKFSYLTLK